MERVASRSSVGLAGWGNPTLPQSGFTLYLRVHSARNLVAVGRGSYCKLYLGNTEVVNGTAQAGASFSNLLATDTNPQGQIQVQGPTHRVFRTKVLYTDQKSCPEWNEKLELHVLDPDKEILTIRVKNQLMLFCPAIGACAIPLSNVTLGQPAEQWFPLHKAGKPAGYIRLQLLLQPKDPTVAAPAAVNESPMQRLIQQHCQQERDRRQQQQSDEFSRRRQFEEQERVQAEMRRQREEMEEKERKRVEEMARVQAEREDRQREEHVKVQAYLQKQVEHEEDWHAEGLVEKVDGLHMDGPEEVTKESINSPNYYFADDMVNASTSVRSSSSSARKQSFAGSFDDSRRGEVVEAVELSGAVLGEVVQDALPSSDSSTSEEEHSRRSAKKSRQQRSRKKSQKAIAVHALQPEDLLFPKGPADEFREEPHRGRRSKAHLADASSSSEETSSSEEERRRRRRRRRQKKKEKKARKKERRRKRKAKRKERRESGGYDGYESSSSSSPSSSSSSSSSSSLSDERYKRKARKLKKSKERARSQREGRTSSLPRASGPPHSNSYGPDHSGYSMGSKSKHSEPAPAYARPVPTQPADSSKSPGYIEPLAPQVQQKRSVSEMLSTAVDVTSIMSNVASIATSVQQLTGGDTGGTAGGIPFAVPDMSQFLGGQDISALAGQDFSGFVGQDFSGLTGDDTTAQFF